MSTSKYAFLSTPAILAGTMIADLGNGEETWNEDRTSSYIAIAQGVGEFASMKVYAALIEEKANLPREDWGYSLHVINNVDGSNCKMKSTKALDEQELVGLLKEIFDELT